MDKIETKEYKGYTIEVYQDDVHDNPVEAWDWDAKLACFHSRYNLVNHDNLDHNDYDSWEAMEKHIRKEYKPKHIQSVYMYEHGCSPLVFSFGKTCEWDSGQVGFIWGDCMKEIESLEAGLKALIGIPSLVIGIALLFVDGGATLLAAIMTSVSTTLMFLGGWGGVVAGFIKNSVAFLYPAFSKYFSNVL